MVQLLQRVDDEDKPSQRDKEPRPKNDYTAIICPPMPQCAINRVSEVHQRPCDSDG